MAQRAKYSIDDLKMAVANARSLAEELTRLGLKPAGGNYKNLRERLVKLEIDFSHLSGQAWARGTSPGPKRPLAEYLVIRPPHRKSTSRLKTRLIAEGY